jgi:hypothetical protein
MTSLELGNKLREMYEINGAKRVTMIHLFGVIYADDMREANVKPLEVVKAAQLPESYGTEVYKGMNLSTYVDLKSKYKNNF